MHIFRHFRDLPKFPKPAVATIGNFDGVHRGHRWVIRNVTERAKMLGFRSSVITFDPHPTRSTRPGTSSPLLTPLEHKLCLLAGTGVDDVVVLPFDGDLARMSARQFAHDILRDALDVRELHEGENFRFGHQAEADIHVLMALGAELGFTVTSYPQQSFHGAAISSSRIRSLIAAGDVSAAHRLLERPFSICGTPASGRGYGTQYTVPTINLAPYSELLPRNGVYLSKLKVGTAEGSSIFEAVTNVGNRPTFGADSFTVESHLLSFHPLELTESTPLELCFLKRVRDERRWPTPELLLQQIGRDVAAAHRYFRLLRQVQRPVR